MGVSVICGGAASLNVASLLFGRSRPAADALAHMPEIHSLGAEEVIFAAKHTVKSVTQLLVGKLDVCLLCVTTILCRFQQCPSHFPLRREQVCVWVCVFVCVCVSWRFFGTCLFLNNSCRHFLKGLGHGRRHVPSVGRIQDCGYVGCHWLPGTVTHW